MAKRRKPKAPPPPPPVSKVIKYITEAEILQLPTYVCARTTRLKYENAVFMWNLIHEENYKVFVFDPLMEKRYETARKYDGYHKLTPFSLITSEYLVFVEIAELLQCRLVGDYSFDVLRSDKTYKIDDSR
ncbi:hypothetical protein D3C71_1533190 [compost metagenome]